MPGESFAIIQRIQSKLFIHPTHSAIKIKSPSSLPAFRDKDGVTFFSHLFYIWKKKMAFIVSIQIKEDSATSKPIFEVIYK